MAVRQTQRRRRHDQEERSDIAQVEPANTLRDTKIRPQRFHAAPVGRMVVERLVNEVRGEFGFIRTPGDLSTDPVNLIY